MSTHVPKVCSPCANGKHSHDRHTGVLPGHPAGTDGGCPNAVDRKGWQPCECRVVLPPRRPGGDDPARDAAEALAAARATLGPDAPLHALAVWAEGYTAGRARERRVLGGRS